MFSEKSDFTNENGEPFDFPGSEQIPNEATLKDRVDTFYTDIEIVTYSDFSMNIKCKKCSSLIKAKC